jgi:hypothetical protein
MLETNNSILSEPETSFEQNTDEVKDAINHLAEEDTQEAHDEILWIAKGHGISVTPSMSTEEIKEKIYEVL